MLRRLAASELIVGLSPGTLGDRAGGGCSLPRVPGHLGSYIRLDLGAGLGRELGHFSLVPGSVETLRAHFRRLAMVRTDEGQRLLFRFYDPRVLGPFVQTCDTAQLREMFGPVTAYMVEFPDGNAVLSFRGPDRLARHHDAACHFRTGLIRPPALTQQPRCYHAV